MYMTVKCTAATGWCSVRRPPRHPDILGSNPESNIITVWQLWTKHVFVSIGKARRVQGREGRCRAHKTSGFGKAPERVVVSTATIGVTPLSCPKLWPIHSPRREDNSDSQRHVKFLREPRSTDMFCLPDTPHFLHSTLSQQTFFCGASGALFMTPFMYFAISELFS